MTSFESAEPFIRLGIFAGLFSFFAILEALFPRRERTHSRLIRWPSNVGISLLNQIVARVLLPVSAMALASYCASSGTGVLNWLELPVYVALAIAVLMLDLSIYLQHRLFHAVPLLWRLHRMHHADTDFDVTTGIRFHPFSIVISAFIKLAAVALIGPTVFAVFIFEVLLNATSLFNHSNLRLPLALERVIRCVVVTPDMHRVHHSVKVGETNSNFGFNFPWWDRFFGTYRAQPEGGHIEMQLGLAQFRESEQLRLDRLLIQPFRDKVDSDGGAAP